MGISDMELEFPLPSSDDVPGCPVLDVAVAIPAAPASGREKAPLSGSMPVPSRPEDERWGIASLASAYRRPDPSPGRSREDLPVSEAPLDGPRARTMTTVADERVDPLSLPPTESGIISPGVRRQ